MESAPFRSLLSTGERGLWSLALLLGAAVLGMLLYAVLAWGAARVLRRAEASPPLRIALLRRLKGPARMLLPVVFVYAVLPGVQPQLSPGMFGLLEGGLFALLVGGVTWLIAAGLRAGEEAVADRYSIDVPDNLRARRIVTQVRILRRVATAIVGVLAVGVVLLQYEPFRELGTGILASAGIVGIVVGIAAQQTLGDLIAGIQIALTQPIRVDDVVIVEGEFGWVEEITLTYVVVRVWDRRRIVMPITHFVESPFQNWTRTSADLIGSVFLHVDHRTPVGAVREELRRIVEASEYWDGDVCALHVTDTSPRGIELRAIASAENAPQLWELRCEIREALVAYLRDEHPYALPVVRARFQSKEDAAVAGAPGTAPDEPAD